MELVKKYFKNLVVPEENFFTPNINFKRALFLSWPFYIFSKVVFLICIVMFLQTFMNYIGNFPEEMGLGFLSKFFNYSAIFKMFFISSLIGIIFFPLIALMDYIFWKILLKWLLQKTGRIVTDENLKLIVTSSFSSYIFLIFPFIGHSLKTISQLYLLTRSLGKTQNISTSLSLFIVCFPMILQFCLFISLVMAAYVAGI